MEERQMRLKITVLFSIVDDEKQLTVLSFRWEPFIFFIVLILIYYLLFIIVPVISSAT